MEKVVKATIKHYSTRKTQKQVLNIPKVQGHRFYPKVVSLKGGDLTFGRYGLMDGSEVTEMYL